MDTVSISISPLDAGGCCGAAEAWGLYCVDSVSDSRQKAQTQVRLRRFLSRCPAPVAAMLPSCCSKPADGSGKRSSLAKLLLGVFVVYTLHTVWLLYGFINTKPCDGGRGELCVSSYLAARPRLQVQRRSAGEPAPHTAAPACC